MFDVGLAKSNLDGRCPFLDSSPLSLRATSRWKKFQHTAVNLDLERARRRCAMCIAAQQGKLMDDVYLLTVRHFRRKILSSNLERGRCAAHHSKVSKYLQRANVSRNRI